MPRLVLSLADKVVSVFLSAGCTEMSLTRFLSEWAKSEHARSREMSLAELSRMAFLKLIEYEDDEEESVSAHLLLNIEKDDCCDFCRFQDADGAAACDLIHTLQPRDFCAFSESSECADFVACKRVHRPKVAMLQRIRDCLTRHNRSSLSAPVLFAAHNELFPQFKAHCPSLRSIRLRINAKVAPKWHRLCVDGDAVQWRSQAASGPVGKHVQRRPVVPEQAAAFKVHCAMSRQWTDKALVADFLQFVRKHHSEAAPSDLYLPRRHRSGYLSFETEAHFLDFLRFACAHNLQCGARTVAVRRWSPSKTNKKAKAKAKGVRVRIQNVGACVSFPQFVSWCQRHAARNAKVHDIQLRNNALSAEQGASYAIICIDGDAQTGERFIRDIDGKLFRGAPMSCRRWLHPRALRRFSASKTPNDGPTAQRRHSSFRHEPFRITRGHPSAAGAGVESLGWRRQVPLTQTRDVDFVDRKAKSRLHQRHALGSKLKSTTKQSKPKKSVRAPPGLADKKVLSKVTKPEQEQQGFARWLIEDVGAARYLDIFEAHSLDTHRTQNQNLKKHQKAPGAATAAGNDAVST